MTHFMNNLTEAEREQLLEAPVLITLLIAGSDNDVDRREIDWAERLMEFRATKNLAELQNYYDSAAKSWTEAYAKYNNHLQQMNSSEERCNFLSERLAEMNPVLEKLSPYTAENLVKSFRSFAVQVAKADGGLLGFGAVSPEENKWLDLSMLYTPQA